MSNPAKVVRWTRPDGKESEQRFDAGHSDRDRRDFLLGLYSDPRRIAAGSHATVTDVSTRKARKRK